MLRKNSEILRRYSFNLKQLGDYNGYVYNQHGAPVGNMKYGGAGKTFAKVGCGVAAIYNVMKFLGFEQNLADAVRDAELLHLTFLGARFGTKTRKLDRYFKYKGVPCEKIMNRDRFVGRLKECRIAIVCSWNKKLRHGIHFYCAYPEKDTGILRTINYRSGEKALEFTPEMIRRDRFVVGYIFD